MSNEHPSNAPVDSLAQISAAVSNLVTAAMTELARRTSVSAAEAVAARIASRAVQLRLVTDWPVTHVVIASLNPALGPEQEPLVLMELHLGASGYSN